MTLEIRQMVIKSNIDKKDAGKAAAEKTAKDGACSDCEGEQNSGERLRARASLLAELERLRER